MNGKNWISGMRNASSKALINKYERLVFVLRGKNRRIIYQLLRSFSCTLSEISEATGIRITNVSRVVKRMEQHGLIKNLTPGQRTGCLYILTPLALEFQSEFDAHIQFRKKKDHQSN